MKKILIIDDEEKLILILRKALRRKDVEVVTATTIEEAEYAIKHTFFNVALTDLRLTGMLGREGIELLHYIEEISPWTKVIIMTGYGSQEIEQEAYQQGAFYYFEKPLDLRILLDRIQALGIDMRGTKESP